MVGGSTSSSSLKEYLKKYQDGNEEEKKKKKRKKVVKSNNNVGVLVVDQDPIWQKPVTMEEEDDDSADEEKPQIDEDIEVKRMKRLEFLKSRRPFGAISEDGSGWVSVAGSQSTDQISNSSPPRRRVDTPSPEHSLRPMSGRELDLSPPRKRGARNGTPSPEYEPKPSSELDLDMLPPRKRRARNDSPSPERKPKSSRAAAEDLSPPRKKLKHPEHPTRDSSPSLGPQNVDISPPRRTRHEHSRASSVTDLSPPRKGRKNIALSSDLYDRYESNPSLGSSGVDLSPPRKKQKDTSSSNQQPKTGLVTGQDIKQENAKAKKEDFKRFKEMDPSISGRGAEPVYRDKVTGERMTKDQYLKSQKKEEKPKEVKLEWGKGLAQKREAEARLQELESEKDKPFARSRDDPELDRMLKERVRFGDPMAHLVKKKQWEPVLEDLGDNEKMKESGFVIPQEVPTHSWIRRGIHPPENRYGIKPGRHWDGVDRSNGFEKQMFTRMNEKQATEREAYLWSVADM